MRLTKYALSFLVILLLGYHITSTQIYAMKLNAHLGQHIAYIQKNYLSHSLEIKLKDTDTIKGSVIHFSPNYFSIGGKITSTEQQITIPKTRNSDIYGSIKGQNVQAYIETNFSILSNPQQPITLKCIAKNLELDTPNGPIVSNGVAVELQTLRDLKLEHTMIHSLKMTNLSILRQIQAEVLSIHTDSNNQKFSINTDAQQLYYTQPNPSKRPVSPLALFEQLFRSFMPFNRFSFGQYAEAYPYPSNFKLNASIDHSLAKLYHTKNTSLSDNTQASIELISQSPAFNNTLNATLHITPLDSALLQSIEIESTSDITDLKKYEAYHNQVHKKFNPNNNPVKLPNLKQKTFSFTGQAVSPKLGSNLHDIEAELYITHIDTSNHIQSTKCSGRIKYQKVLILPRYIEINGRIQRANQRATPLNLKEIFRMDTEIPATESHLVQYIERTNNAKEPIKSIISYVPSDAFSLIQSIISN